MQIKYVALAKVGVKTEQFPENNLPELAFIGKSNVGKSSLINTMVQRKALARTSQNPGKTRTINFYDVNHTLHFVDLPGYGYAKISKSESAKWGTMIENYLQRRSQLEHIFLLIDIRHEPSKNDQMMYDWLMHYNHPVTIIATKQDKVKRSQIPKHLKIIRQTLNMPKEQAIVPFSSLNKVGTDALWQVIETFISPSSDSKPG